MKHDLQPMPKRFMVWDKKEGKFLDNPSEAWRKKTMSKPEEILQEKVANYLVQNYPDVLFHSDFGSGAKLTPGQAIKQKRQNGGRRAWPDMLIAEPKPVHYFTGRDDVLPGLFLELKKDGTRLKKKNGEWASEHIAEQAEVLEGLRQRGYWAEFAIGFEEAKRIIDEYLGKEN